MGCDKSLKINDFIWLESGRNLAGNRLAIFETPGGSGAIRAPARRRKTSGQDDAPERTGLGPAQGAAPAGSSRVTPTAPARARLGSSAMGRYSARRQGPDWSS